jgi:hypothetical protein
MVEGTVVSPPTFILPGTGNNPPVTTKTGKKMFFIIRMMMPTLGAFTVGIANATATDGILIQGNASGISQISNLVSAAHSPSGALATKVLHVPPMPPNVILAGAWFGMGLEIDRYQNLSLFLGTQLVGWIPQSGTGGPFLPDGTPTTVVPSRGKVFTNYNFLAQNTGLASIINPIMLTLAPVGVYMHFTGQVDFVGIFKER